MITKELRKYACGKVPSKHLEDLIGIADAIEQAHEEAMKTAQAEELLECISIPDSFIELPKDADGKAIHVGDRIEYNTGGVDVVRFITFNDGGWLVNERGWKAETMHHVQPDSWERIIKDALRGAEREGSPDTYPECVAELVERCKRLAGDGE